MKVFSVATTRGRLDIYNRPPAGDWAWVEQIHSNRLVMAQKCGAQADGLVDLTGKTPLLIKTADCLCILLEGERGRALLHAGWRGLKAGIHKDKMLLSLNVQEIWIGPAICRHHYPVGAEFRHYFPNSPHLHKQGPEGQEQFFFDLVGQAQEDLLELFPQAALQLIPHCTWEHPHLHSFRREGTPLRNYHLYTPL